MTIVLVDGSNVALSEAWRTFVAVEDAELGRVPRTEARERERHLKERLLDWILYWSVPRGLEAVVVFDGDGPVGAGDQPWGAGRVIGAGARDGDAVVERTAAECVAAGQVFRLVTDDAVLRQVAGARAQVTIDVASFIAEVTIVEPAGDGHRGRGAGAELQPGTRIAATLDDETRARLERMRRGEA